MAGIKPFYPTTPRAWRPCDAVRVARRSVIDSGPITFQATLPERTWLRVDKDQGTLTLVVPLDVAAVLTAATHRLADRVLRVTMDNAGDELEAQ